MELSDYKTGSRTSIVFGECHTVGKLNTTFVEFEIEYMFVGVYSPLEKANLIPPLSTPHNPFLVDT